MAEKTKNADFERVPFLASIWLSVYNAVPKIRLPGSSLDIGFTIVCSCVFYCIRLAIIRMLHQFGWPEENLTRSAAGSLVGGFFHTSNLVPISYVLIKAAPTYNPSSAMKDHPQWWQDTADAALQLCGGYFVYDTVVGFLIDAWVPGKGPVLGDGAIIFLLHHFLSLFYVLSVRYYGAGEQSLFMCVLLGETTNPAFNSYLVSQSAKKLACCNGPFAMQVITAIEIVTAIVYIPFRAVIGPVVGAGMSYNIICSKSARANLPMWVRVIWTVVLWAIGIGSIPYVLKFVDILKLHLGGGADGVEEEL